MKPGKVVGNTIVCTYSGVKTELVVVTNDMVRINSNNKDVYFQYNLAKDELRAVVNIGGLLEAILKKRGTDGKPVEGPMKLYTDLARAVRIKAPIVDITMVLRVRAHMNKKLREFTNSVLHDPYLDILQMIYFDNDLADWCHYINDNKLIISGLTIRVTNELRDAIKDSLLMREEPTDGEKRRYLYDVIGRTLIDSYISK